MTPAPSDFRLLLHARREHFRALLELSRRQAALIAADDYTALLDVLGGKQRLLGRLDEINRSDPDLRQRWQAGRKALDPSERRECEAILAETETLLAELLREEQAGTRQLTERRDATQQQLQSITHGSRLHDAYRDGLAPVTHRHLDLGQ